MLSTQINYQYYMSLNPHQYSAEHHDGARELKGRNPSNKLQGSKVTKHELEIQLANQVTQHNIDKLKESTHSYQVPSSSAKPKITNSKVLAKPTVIAKINKSKTVLKGVGAKPTTATNFVAKSNAPKTTSEIILLS
jgi:hypothetical protein